MSLGKLLIAEANAEYGILLQEELKDRCETVLCSSGRLALSLIRERCPDILVLDLVLPDMDGLSLLHTLSEEGLHPSVLVISDFISPYISQSLLSLGVDYLMRKPCDLRSLCSRIQDLQNTRCPKTPEHWDLRSRIAFHLKYLGVNPLHAGYAYLAEAIAFRYTNPGAAITKEIYPAIAKKYRVEVTQVERDMRNAIEKAWASPSRTLWYAYFLPEKIQAKRPSNGYFISCLAAALVQDQKLSENKR